MNEAAQIILAVGASLAVILFALNGPLSTVLNRGNSPRRSVAQVTLSRREWCLLALAFLSAVPSVVGLLSRLI
jgi:hypothetical protein